MASNIHDVQGHCKIAVKMCRY